MMPPPSRPASPPPLSPPPVSPRPPSGECIREPDSIHLRENPEPTAKPALIPVWLVLYICAALVVGSIYLMLYRGDFDPLVYDERYVPGAGGVASSAQITPEQMVAQGQKLYQTCATCHQATGQGLVGNYPPLAGSEWVQGSEERVIRILLHGLGGELKVHGETYNGNMPAFGPGGGYNWKDDRIAYVLTYIRQEWGNTAGPVTPEKVKEVRTATADRKIPWTQAELEAIE